ncbi:hypothetical protein KIW84_051374 [Lathyrus oleraceus]|uniref:SUEL-type lectin domain-containing protein n=1 Tax=Pisum sativum TaxID=3888 RepID=A0A9D4WJV9_PEA|nr:hypothetical protein KIW84_051374 [Pisum sativum]
MASDPVEDTLQAIGTFNASQLLEQKSVTVDASDYLWYMTKVFINETSTWSNATLQVNTSGHVLHAYVNGQYIGPQWGTYDNLRFTYEKIVSLKQGTNIISLLSGTVGHAHYGASFDMKETGIVGGPVKLIATSSGKPLTWYKTTFKTPEGKDSVVVDFIGLTKGHAWVNGQSIGRSFLNNDTKSNTLVCLRKWVEALLMCLFKQLQLILYVQEQIMEKTLELKCPDGKTISEIQFASYGDPQGNCGLFQVGEWESRHSVAVVEKACGGKQLCSINVTSSIFGITKGGINGQLAVQLLCDGSNPEDNRVQMVHV